MIAAWCFTVVGAGLAAGWSIEHPEYLSVPPIVLGLTVSAIFIGIPLAIGLLAVQAPAFERSLLKTGSHRRAWLTSIIANAVYAAALTPVLLALSWLRGNEVTAPIAVWAAFLLIVCSIMTSFIWLTFNALLTKAYNA